MRRPSAEKLYYGLSFGLRMPTWVVPAVYFVRELHLSPLQLVLMGPLYTIWLNEQTTDPSVRTTVFSTSGQGDAIGQAAGGPFLGAIGTVWGIRAALAAAAAALVPASALYARAGRDLGLEDLPQLAG